jgi:hypothetical protein
VKDEERGGLRQGPQGRGQLLAEWALILPREGQGLEAHVFGMEGLLAAWAVLDMCRRVKALEQSLGSAPGWGRCAQDVAARLQINALHRRGSAPQLTGDNRKRAAVVIRIPDEQADFILIRALPVFRRGSRALTRLLHLEPPQGIADVL